MSPECSVICIDNSEFMRNCDYSPTRFHSLYDAINVYVQGKSKDNLENNFGVLSLTGFELLCSLTTDQNRVMSRIHYSPIKGNVNFIKSLKIAELVLDQREIKQYTKRIISFIGSPFTINSDEITELGCKFLENNVAVDIILFGEYNEIVKRQLMDFIDLLNETTDKRSHFICVPPGDSLSRILRSSEIMPLSQRPKQLPNNDFDFDAENDPDLAEAIRLSLQDQNLQQTTSNIDDNQQSIEVNDDSQFEQNVDLSAMTEEEQIEWALRLSLKDDLNQQNKNNDKD